MDANPLIERLERNIQGVGGLLDGVPRSQAVWKPDPEKWSLLEVAAHLLDEEREDFRVRLDILLHKPGAPWPPIDPQGWVDARRYLERDLEETVRSWREERRSSVDWLRRLRDPDWRSAQEHPAGGVLRAGDMLASWLAHDYLHLRQLSRLHFGYARQLVAPFTPDYAGEW